MKTPTRSELVKSLIGLAIFVAICGILLHLALNWFSETWQANACPDLVRDEFPELSAEQVEEMFESFPFPHPLEPQSEENAQDMAETINRSWDAQIASCREYLRRNAE